MRMTNERYLTSVTHITKINNIITLIAEKRKLRHNDSGANITIHCILSTDNKLRIVEENRHVVTQLTEVTIFDISISIFRQ